MIRLPRFKKKQRDNLISGLSLESDGIACAQVSTQNGLHIQTAVYEPHQNGAWPVALETVIDRQQLEGDVYISLSGGFYNLLLIDAPDVASDEMADAIKWKVKDLISQPLDKVSIQYFLLPDDAYRGRMNMVYVAVVERALIQQLVNVCEEKGLTIAGITIEELALNNLLFSSGITEGDSTGMVTLGASNGQMRLVECGNLYLARNLDIGVDRLNGLNEDELSEYDLAQCNEMMFDIKRSLDYYESQLGKGMANRVIIMPADVNTIRLASVLNEKLELAVQPWHWQYSENISYESLPFEVLDKCISAVGAVTGGWLEN